MSSQKFESKKTYALLDVDSTLIFPDGIDTNSKKLKNKININLLNALKSKGIKDIYLFTDMTFRASGIKERLELIADLKKQGFRVHGVITPCDKYFKKIENLNKLQQNELHEHLYSPKSTFGSAFEKLTQFTSAISNKHRVSPGESFEMATKIYKNELELNNIEFDEFKQLSKGYELQKLSNMAKALHKLESIKLKYEHQKGVMLYDFVINSNKAIVICDDSKPALQSYEAVSDKKEVTSNITILAIDPKHGCNETEKSYAERIENKIFEYNKSATTTTTSQMPNPMTIPRVMKSEIISAIKEYEEKNFIKLNNTQKKELNSHFDKLRIGDISGAIELFDSILKMLDKKSGADLIVKALESITHQIDFTPCDRELFNKLYQFYMNNIDYIEPENQYKLGVIAGFFKDYLNKQFPKVESTLGAKKKTTVEENFKRSFNKLLSQNTFPIEPKNVQSDQVSNLSSQLGKEFGGEDTSSEGNEIVLTSCIPPVSSFRKSEENKEIEDFSSEEDSEMYIVAEDHEEEEAQNNTISFRDKEKDEDEEKLVDDWFFSTHKKEKKQFSSNHKLWNKFEKIVNNAIGRLDQYSKSKPVFFTASKNKINGKTWRIGMALIRAKEHYFKNLQKFKKLDEKAAFHKLFEYGGKESIAKIASEHRHKYQSGETKTHKRIRQELGIDKLSLIEEDELEKMAKDAIVKKS